VVRCMFHISLVFRCVGLCHYFFTVYIIISIELECRWFTALLHFLYCTVVVGSLHFWLTGSYVAVAYYCVEVFFCIVFFLCAELCLCVCASCFLRS